jgi:hypothetical protein
MKKIYPNKRAQENINWFITYHGAIKCEKCGYAGSATDFHHTLAGSKLDPSDTMNWHIQNNALDKFISWVEITPYAVLCANCHRELHNNEWQLKDIDVTIKTRELEQAKKRAARRQEHD